MYKFKHREEQGEVEIKEVEKMLTCGDRGYRMYACPKCGEIETIHFGCNSRVCTHCGKKFADKWVDKIAKETFDVKHRHVVLTIPEELRPFFREDRTLLKVMMDCGMKVIGDVMKWTLRKEATPRMIAVVQHIW